MNTPSSLLMLADQCVKCGLCLPQCPTYQLGMNENESPRGRISLIQAVGNNQLEVSDKLLIHLDHCLQCRRCERVCPSQVQYGELVQRARYEFKPLRPKTSIAGRAGLWFIEKTWRRTALRQLLRFYQRSGLQCITRRSGLLGLLGLKNQESRLPALTKTRLAPHTQAASSSRNIALFTGCTQPLFDTQAIASAQVLLTRLGYNVVIPEQQVCCGALHTQQGRQQKTRQLLAHNAQLFNSPDYERVVYLASGCGAFLREQTGETFKHFEEITAFILADSHFSGLKFNPLNSRVAVHLPCSQKNVLKQDNTALSLLQQIPGIQLLDLASSGCCGAGATTMIRYPEMANQVRQPLLDLITDEHTEVVVTTNPGCQLHLQAGVSSQEVIHPLTLLARQLI